MKVKALTLWQPWATLIALGEKQYETRSWGTEYRGLLAIHAAKRKPGGFMDAANALARHDIAKWSDLPRGAVVALVRLVDVIPTSYNYDFVDSLSDKERSFGDFRFGRYAWKLDLICPVQITASGHQGLWHWHAPDSVRQLLRGEVLL